MCQIDTLPRMASDLACQADTERCSPDGLALCLFDTLAVGMVRDDAGAPHGRLIVYTAAVNLYFCGLIGSGKTTIGRAVAAHLGLDFYDIDQEIDRRVGYSFHRLVAEQGWVPYRETEYAICRDLAQISNAVVSMAGGTVRYQWNMDILHGTGPIIFLQAPLDELARRVRAADRPRVNPGTTLEEDLRLMWENHGHKYIGAADMVYRTDEKTVEEEIADMLALIETDARFAGWPRR